MIKYNIQAIIDHHIPVTIINDFESLSKIIVNSIVTIERRLMIDVNAAREAYVNNETSGIGWITTKNNVADNLPNLGKCDPLEILLNF